MNSPSHEQAGRFLEVSAVVSGLLVESALDTVSNNPAGIWIWAYHDCWTLVCHCCSTCHVLKSLDLITLFGESQEGARVIEERDGNNWEKKTLCEIFIAELREVQTSLDT